MIGITRNGRRGIFGSKRRALGMNRMMSDPRFLVNGSLDFQG